MVGQTISHYKILGKIGEGGMGVVYKAEDTRLRRTVALKFIRSEAVENEEVRTRFLHEAEAAAALTHPNICIVHEIDEAEGNSFIAMEYVEGESLKEKIEKRPLPLEDALGIAIQVAEGLHFAHEKGIVHRDITPANVMFDSQGRAKIMDFGLAHLGDATQITKTGTIVGTPAYISPEQIRGEKADPRADIWSLGLVLYEMVAGRRPFHGESAQTLALAIQNEEPEPLTAVRTRVPVELDRVAGKALAKSPANRYQHVDELLVDLRSLKRQLEKGTGQQHPSPQPQSRTNRAAWYVTGAVILLVLFALGGTWLGLWELPGKAREAPLATVPLTSYPGTEACPAFSPGGDYVAFSWNGPEQDNFDIYRKRIGTQEALRLTTDPAPDYCPSWSPDGKHIAFVRGSGPGEAEIILVPELGVGAEKRLTTITLYLPESLQSRCSRPAWSKDGQWLVIPDKPDSQDSPGLFAVSVETREKHRLTSGTDHFPAISPDGNTLAFSRGMGISGALYSVRVSGQAVAESEPRQLTAGSMRPEHVSWLPNGRELVFAGSPGLYRVSISGTGQPTRLPFAWSDASQTAVSPAGNRLAYRQSSGNQDIMRAAITAAGTHGAPPSTFASSSRREANPRYSPDGSRVAFASSRSGVSEIWVCDADGSNSVQLTSFGETHSGSPRWTPDGEYVLFNSSVTGHSDIYRLPADGGKPERLTTHPRHDGDASASLDGRWIYFSSERTGEYQVWKLPADGGEPVQLTQNGGWMPFESPDGQYVYYASKELAPGVWRIPRDGGEEKEIIPEIWSPHCFSVSPLGIYFITRDGASVNRWNYDTGETVELLKIEKPGGFGFDVSPDGKWVLYTHSEPTSDLVLVEGFQ